MVDNPHADIVGESTEQVVLILAGLIGSGKSTFAEALARHFPNYRRCNQDDLGDRRAVEDLARQSLSQGLSVCIDRTNFNASQRRYWIDIAREFPGTLIWVIVFDTPYEECAARIKKRVSHPTIKSVEQGMSVLARFASDFRAPKAEEGFDRLISIKPDSHPEPTYSPTDIKEILQRLRNSPQLYSPRVAFASPHLPIPSDAIGRDRFSTLNMFWGRNSDYLLPHNSPGHSQQHQGRGRGRGRATRRGGWRPRGHHNTLTGRGRGSSGFDSQSVD